MSDIPTDTPKTTRMTPVADIGVAGPAAGR